MDALQTESEIDELRRIRRQTGWWRIGSGAIIAIWMTGCLISVNDSVRGLFVAGPRQEKFVSTLSGNVQRDVTPTVQNLAAQTIAQARPEVESSFIKLNEHVPALAQASFAELETLQTSLPQKGQKILGDTFGTMIAQKEVKLREMFPEATEEQIHAVATNLTDLAQTRAVAVNDRLIGRHQVAMNNIVTHIEKIKLDESHQTGSPLGTNWEMALAVMDIVRDDMHNLETMAAKNQKANALKTTASAAMPGSTNKDSAK